MSQQMLDSHATVRQIRKIFCNRIIKTDYSSHTELQHRHRSKLFGDRGEVKQGVFGNLIVFRRIAARRLSRQTKFPVGMFHQHRVAHRHQHHSVQLLRHIIGHKFQSFNIIAINDGVPQLLQILFFRKKRRISVCSQRKCEAQKYGYKK